MGVEVTTELPFFRAEYLSAVGAVIDVDQLRVEETRAVTVFRTRAGMYPGTVLISVQVDRGSGWEMFGTYTPEGTG